MAKPRMRVSACMTAVCTGGEASGNESELMGVAIGWMKNGSVLLSSECGLTSTDEQ